MGNSGDGLRMSTGGPRCLQQAEAASCVSPKSLSAPSPLSWALSFYQLPTGCLHLGQFRICLKLGASLPRTTKSAPMLQVSPPTKVPQPETWVSASDHSPWCVQNLPWFCTDNLMSWEMPLSQFGNKLASWSQLKCCPLPYTMSSQSPSPANCRSL